MKVPFYIAKRYVFSRSKSSAINVITRITTVGIFIGTLVMFVILSVFSGLREYSLQFVNGSDPDLRMVSTVGKMLELTSDKKQQIDKTEGIASYSSYLEERVLLRYDSKEQIAYIKGVDHNYGKVNSIQDFIFLGEWNADANHAIVGATISYKLSIGIFDYDNILQVIVPKAGKGTISQNDFNKINLKPIGIYSFENDEMDSRYAYTNLSMVQYLLQVDSTQVTGIEFKLKPKVSESKIKSELTKIFGEDISVKNRMELNDTLYKMLNTENLVVYLIITLVIIITLFTLIGTLIMVILDKQQNLETLYNIGLRVVDIKKIFLYQGVLLSFFGCFLGLLLGVLIVLLQQKIGFWMLTPTLPYPVKFTLINILISFATIMTLGFIASKIASDRVSEKNFR